MINSKVRPLRVQNIVMRGFLVIFLMITPLRSVLASPGNCDMADMDMAQTLTQGVFLESASPDSLNPKLQNNDDSVHQCCDETTALNCQNHCGMNVYVSILLQSPSLIESGVAASQFETVSLYPVFRQQTPLLRPPPHLHS